MIRAWNGDNGTINKKQDAKARQKELSDQKQAMSPDIQIYILKFLWQNSN